MPSRIGSFGLREPDGHRPAGRRVVALVDGFHLLDLDTGELEFLAGPPHEPGTRFNDGKVSPDGRFWAGTMDEESLSRPIAALYRLDPDHTVHRVVDGLIVSNGLGWTADGRTMFHSDSKGQVIWAYDYDPDTGTPSDAGWWPGPPRRSAARTAPHRRGRATTGAPASRPACSTGGHRTAGWTGRIPLPCSNPTAPCFGGAGPANDLRHLAAARPADRRAGGQAAVRRHLRRPGRRAGRADQPIPRLTSRNPRAKEEAPQCSTSAWSATG